MTISNQIKTLRKEKKLTKAQLAKALGVSITTVSRWEKNADKIKGSNIIKLSRFFEVTVDYILCLERIS